MSATRCSLAARALSLALAALACRDKPAKPAPAAAPDAAAPPWQAASSRAPTPPRGMVWVPEGALVAGTPEGRLPRFADQEMAGPQMVLHGFFIDAFAYPNEEGAIPKTGVTQAQAEALCAEQNKRLCTELEWERACKGPENTTYEYGERYRADVCLTGRPPRMLPNGFRQGCRSEFGVRDMHGGVWEWTASRWGRGTTGSLAALRGGNDDAGDVVGRCANATPRAPNSASSQVGFRCCMGEPNPQIVTLSLERGEPLEQRPEAGPLATKLQALLPDEVDAAFASSDPMHLNTVWDYRPIANTHLVVGGGCGGPSGKRRCGVAIADLVNGEPSFLLWVWAGVWPPALRVSTAPRKLWVYGGDRTSQLRVAVYYEAGRVRVGELQRKLREGGEWIVPRTRTTIND